MRIAMFTDNFYPELGGIQDSILLSARELGARGHAVAIFAPAAARRDFTRAGVVISEQQIGGNVTVHRMFSLPMPGSTGQSRLVPPAARCGRALAAFGPELIHSHTFLGAGWAARAAARRLAIPLVGTNHWAVGGFSLYAPFARTACARIAWRGVTRYYNHCVWVSAPSQATLSDMRQHGLRSAGAVVSNPIDTNMFRPPAPLERQRLRAQWQLAGPAIVYAGRLAREKRIDVLIRALPALRALLPDSTLLLAGHGTEGAALQALARRVGVAGHVRFTGTLPHDALAGLYGAADAFAIASTSESQSMALLQAMSAGLPAVGARQGPLVEYIPPSAGALAEPEDPGSFAMQLAGIVGAPARRAHMAAHAATFAARFGVPPVVDAWQGIYARICRTARHDTVAPRAWSRSCA